MKNIEIDENTRWIFPHCPTLQDLNINWTEILADFPSLQPLAHCQQSPIYHAEGNVWIDTQLVCEALVSLSAWQAMNETDRSILFAAALFHDIAKPASTQIDEEGKITAKGHGALGARMVRRIFQDLHTPFAIREAIVAIVEYGSLPLWFWNKDRPLKSIIRASQIARCDCLALMAEADVRGRICADRERLLETIEFFREFCREYDCFDRPYQFASAHSRFVYFQKEDGEPSYAAYDDTRLEVILMCGIPGTGKDYWIEHHHPDLPMVSLDRLREEMGISPTDEQGAIVQAGKDLAKGYLKTATPFVWNATNIVKPIRSGLIQLFASYNARIRIVYLEAPIERVLQQNRDRSRFVPPKVIHRFRDRIEIPNITECHHLDTVVEVR
jgi:putative nucleotidyltransferase with HDIG domain